MKSEDADYLLLRSDFEELIEDIKRVYISKEYAGLYSWLINRAFQITSGVKSKSNIIYFFTKKLSHFIYIMI